MLCDVFAGSGVGKIQNPVGSVAGGAPSRVTTGMSRSGSNWNSLPAACRVTREYPSKNQVAAEVSRLFATGIECRWLHDQPGFPVVARNGETCS
jgi:hypothetical protein